MVKRLTPELDRLLKRIRAATKRRGSRAELATMIGVLPPTLSDWLRGRYEPGGEITLQLQKWVIAAESKQKTDPARADTRTGKMTQKSKSKAYEKAKSDRPEG